MILAAGLTPAWQHILCFERLLCGEVNRAREAHWCGSGKVLNVGRAVALLLGTDAERDCLAFAPLGGTAEHSICEEFYRDGIPLKIFSSATPTRVCTTLLDEATGQSTELVENMRALSANELAEYALNFRELARAAQTVVLSGSLPQEAPANYFAELLAGYSGDAILDVRGPELMAALPLRPWLVKPNREELAKTIGRALASDDDVISGMQELQRMGARNAAITDGARDVLLLTEAGKLQRIRPPRIERIVNPIGSGDSFAAGAAVAAARGEDVVQAVKLGIAAAAANVETLLPARWERARIEELAAMIEVQD